MATTIQQRIDALKEVLGTGALSVEHDGKKVTYRSRSQILAEIQRLEAEQGTKTQWRQSFAKHRRD